MWTDDYLPTRCWEVEDHRRSNVAPPRDINTNGWKAETILCSKPSVEGLWKAPHVCTLVGGYLGTVRTGYLFFFSFSLLSFLFLFLSVPVHMYWLPLVYAIMYLCTYKPFCSLHSLFPESAFPIPLQMHTTHRVYDALQISYEYLNDSFWPPSVWSSVPWSLAILTHVTWGWANAQHRSQHIRQ